MNTQNFLLDTHTWLWLQEGKPDSFSLEALDLLEESSIKNQIFVSVISVWEIGMLEAKKRIELTLPLLEWIHLALKATSLVNITPEIAIESSHLPGHFHKDPADRILVATARAGGLTLVTRDREILNYSQKGHVKTLSF